MLFYIDESWQWTRDKKYMGGVLSAVQIKSTDFNDCSNQIFSLKTKYFGSQNRENELKGKELLKKYFFRLEATGIKSLNLILVREILSFIKSKDIHYFASVVFSEKEILLSCADANQIERPFYYLFERIDLFMKENYPESMAQIIFDDRGLQTNIKISKTVSNFFHRSRKGQSFDSVIKAPLFAISSENIGIQLADIGAYILGRRFTGERDITEFFYKIKELEFISKTQVVVNGKERPIQGIKVIKN